MVIKNKIVFLVIRVLRFQRKYNNFKNVKMFISMYFEIYSSRFIEEPPLTLLINEKPNLCFLPLLKIM